MQTKMKYNNYQYYEIEALSNSLETKKNEGLQIFGYKGDLLRILKFKITEVSNDNKICVFRKHIDKHIDDFIDVLLKENITVVTQSDYYIILEMSKENYSNYDVESIIKEQNEILSLSLKKAIILNFIRIMTLFMSFYFNFKYLDKTLLDHLGTYMAILFFGAFIMYFIGDIHDLIKYKDNMAKGKIFFKERSLLKNKLFLCGDIIKFICFAISIIFSAIVLIYDYNVINLIVLIFMWLCGSLTYFFTTIKFQGSYFALLRLALVISILF